MKTFVEGMKSVSIKGLTADANGVSYLPWPTAIGLAGRPNLNVVTFENESPVKCFFGGAVVAIEGVNGERKQRIWLPVMDANHKSVPCSQIDVRDVNDSISRCRAKAVAMLHGVGFSLYAGYGDNNIGFLRDLGVKPTSDISKVEPLTVKKPGKAGASYVEWSSAFASAKLTDQDFHFEVLEFKNVDMETGEEQFIPAQRVGNSWMVAVKLTYKGRDHVEWLPIMGQADVMTKNGLKKLDHQPLLNPTTHDWNRAVMRCLTRGIAMLTGYGLSVYAREDLATLHSKNDEKSNNYPAVATTEAEAAKEIQPKTLNEVLIKPNDDIPEAHFLNNGLTVQEPDEITSRKLVVRIGNIKDIQSLHYATEQIKQQYAGTKALDVFLSALDVKKASLIEQQAA